MFTLMSSYGSNWRVFVPLTMRVKADELLAPLCIWGGTDKQYDGGDLGGLIGYEFPSFAEAMEAAKLWHEETRPKLYDVVYLKDNQIDPDPVYEARGLSTLAEARAARKVAGDIVVHHGTLDVVVNPQWLWDWERESQNNYAKNKMIAAGWLS